MAVNFISFDQYTLTVEHVMTQFQESGSEFYEDIIDELLEDIDNEIHPFGYWVEVPVTEAADNAVDLGNDRFYSSYLKKRLQGVDRVYVFATSIGEELWEQRVNSSDPLEQMLFDSIMKTCLNDAFARTASDIVSHIDDNAVLYMDNPGNLSGWDLSDLRKLMDLLIEEAGGSLPGLSINDDDLIETSYSLSGIIYGKERKRDYKNLPPVSEINPQDLIQMLYESSGHPDEY
ncbi:MAG: hypothetical protein ACSW8A_04095 [Lachnospiraceae bacterium]